MRILIVSPYFPPQRGAASIRLWSFVQSASQAGIDIDVLTTTKHPDQVVPWVGDFDGRVHEVEYDVPGVLRRFRKVHKQEESSGEQSRSAGSGRLIQRTLGRLRDYTGIYSSVRMPDLTDYWVKPAINWAHNAAAEHGPWDVMLSSAGPYTAHLVALKIKELGLAKSWVADFRDLWTANQPYGGLFPFTIRERALERRVLAGADALVTVSEPMLNWLSARSHAPVDVVYNGYSQLSHSSSTPGLSISGRPIQLVFTGRLYAQCQNARFILQAIQRLRASGTDIVLTIAGASSTSWQRLASDCGVCDAVKILGEVPHEQALEMQRQADGLVAFEWNDPEAGVLTSKIFEYIAAGPPVLITGPAGPMGQLLSRTRSGVHLGSCAKSVEQSLRLLIQGDQELPSRVPSEIEKLSRSAQSQRLVEICQRFV